MEKFDLQDFRTTPKDLSSRGFKLVSESPLKSNFEVFQGNQNDRPASFFSIKPG